MSAPTVADFLRFRFRHNGPNDTIELRTFWPDDRPGPRSWHRDPAKAADAAQRLSRKLNAYYGICPRTDGGGTKGHVTAITAAWADVDFKHYADGRDGALAALEAFALPPTWIVDSGGGYQAIWEFAAPSRDLALIPAFEAMQKRLYAALGGLDLSLIHI